MSAVPGTLAIRTVLVEDHTLVRQSVARILGAEDDFVVVGEAGDPGDVVPLVLRVRPHLVLLDVSLPGASGLHVAAQLRAHAPGVRIVFLTMHDDDATVARAVAVGADGYLLKTASHEELLQCLRAVASGGSYLSPAVARRVMRRAGSHATAEALTDRELEILSLLSEGVRPADVARMLFVSIKTVRNHLASIYLKLGVQTATQAVSEAFRRGLVARV